MAILAGPSAGYAGAIQAIVRNSRAEPFGQDEGMVMGTSREDVALLAIKETLKAIHKLLAILATITDKTPPKEDDFMQGWGKDDLEEEK